MKYQHAKHVIHQIEVLGDRREGLKKKRAALCLEKIELDELPDRIRAEIVEREAEAKRIDLQIEVLLGHKASLLKLNVAAQAGLKDAGRPAAAKADEVAVVDVEIARVVRRLEPFLKEEVRARARIAEIAAKDAERIEGEAMLEKIKKTSARADEPPATIRIARPNL
jgi:hypothetical protein